MARYLVITLLIFIAATPIGNSYKNFQRSPSSVELDHDKNCVTLLSKLITRPSNKLIKSIKKRWSYIFIPSNFKNMNFDDLQESREYFRQQIKESKIDDSLYSDLPMNQKMSYLLALNDSINVKDLNYTMFDGWEKTSYLRKRKIFSTLDKIDFQKGITKRQLNELVSKLFLATKGSPHYLDHYFKSSKQTRNLKLINRLLHEDLFYNGMYKMLKSQDLINSETWWQRTISVLNNNKIKTALSLLYNYNLIDSIGKELFVPIIPFIERSRFSSKDLIYIQKMGKDGIPKLLKHHDLSISANDYYQTFKRLYTPVMQFLFAYMAYEEYVKTISAQKKAKEDEQNKAGQEKANEITEMLDGVSQNSLAIINAPEISNTVLDEALNKFREENGREPSEEEMQIFITIFSIAQ